MLKVISLFAIVWCFDSVIANKTEMHIIAVKQILENKMLENRFVFHYLIPFYLFGYFKPSWMISAYEFLKLYRNVILYDIICTNQLNLNYFHV